MFPMLPRALHGRPVLRCLAATIVVAISFAACDSGNAHPPSNGLGGSNASHAGGAVVGATSPGTGPSGSSGSLESSAGTRTISAATAGSAGGGSATTSGATTQTATSTDPTPLIVVTGFENYKLNAITMAQLTAKLAGGRVLVPCGAETAVAAVLHTTRSGWASCVAAERLTDSLPVTSTRIGLLPPGLVGPGVKVVPLDGVDLFGEGPQRAGAYPLVIASPGWKTSWTSYASDDVRIVVTTGVNCADRGVSRETNTLGKGWEWLLNAGTARYTGTHYDSRLGWNVVDAVRTGHLGAIKALIKNADLAVSDFECPMSSHFTQHDSGTLFTVDPKVAALMKEGGFDVATIGSDHMTNAGITGLLETTKFFDQNGIKHVGAGANLAAALKPAVFNVRGLRFAFFALNAAGGSTPAGPGNAGTASLTTANIKTAAAAARKQADVVFALPQWSTTEYRAGFLTEQLSWRNQLFAAGVDHIIGADFHWAGALSITAGGVSGNHLAVASVGNFWFGQDWSRQTQEGYMTMITFVGKRLAQVRLIPTVVLDDAQPNLVDPATDGQFTLKQAFGPSIVKPVNPQ